MNGLGVGKKSPSWLPANFVPRKYFPKWLVRGRPLKFSVIDYRSLHFIKEGWVHLP